MNHYLHVKADDAAEAIENYISMHLSLIHIWRCSARSFAACARSMVFVYTNLSVLGIELEEICRSLVEHPVRCDYLYVKMRSLSCGITTVSYTHLDVYKRQGVPYGSPSCGFCPSCLKQQPSSHSMVLFLLHSHIVHGIHCTDVYKRQP